MDLMKSFKYTTDILIEHKLYEKEEKFQTYTNQHVKKHPFGLVLTRIAKCLSIFTQDANEKAYEHFDQLLLYNSWENLDILIYFTKPIDESTQKLREFSLKTLRNLYFSGHCSNVQERLDKIRFTDVIAYVTSSFGSGGAKGSFEYHKDLLMKQQ